MRHDFCSEGEVDLREERSETRAVLKALLGVAVVLLLVMVWIEFCQTGETKDVSYFWVQMFSGSAWPDWKVKTEHNHVFFAVAGTVHALITAGPLLGIGWIIYKLISTRSAAMTIAQVLVNRDRSLKFEISSVLARTLPADLKQKVSAQLDDAFAKADDSWKEDLVTVLGEERAHSIIERITQTTLVG